MNPQILSRKRFMSESQKIASFDSQESLKVWDIGWSLLKNILKIEIKLINNLILFHYVIKIPKGLQSAGMNFLPRFIRVGQSSTSIINWPKHSWISVFEISTINFSISSRTGSTWNFERDKLSRISYEKGWLIWF